MRLECYECGRDFDRDENGVSRHLRGDHLDHDADADHVPYESLNDLCHHDGCDNPKHPGSNACGLRTCSANRCKVPIRRFNNGNGGSSPCGEIKPCEDHEGISVEERLKKTEAGLLEMSTAYRQALQDMSDLRDSLSLAYSACPLSDTHAIFSGPCHRCGYTKMRLVK